MGPGLDASRLDGFSRVSTFEPKPNQLKCLASSQTREVDSTKIVTVQAWKVLLGSSLEECLFKAMPPESVSEIGLL